MNPPKMILFDIGRTLIDYGEFCTRKGVDALMPYLVQKSGCRPEELWFVGDKLSVDVAGR